MYAVIPGKAKPSKSLSTDKTRPILQHAELRETDDGWELVTCDSYQMARVKLEISEDNGEPLTPGPISMDALKAIEKSRGFTANGSVTPCDRYGTPAGPSYPRPDVGTFPQWDQLTPEAPLDSDALVIGLDAKLLAALEQSLATDSYRGSHVYLRLDLSKVKDGAYLKPLAVSRNGRDFDGLLMPVRVKS